MMDSTDMSTPVTRGELQDTLGLFKQELRIEHQHELRAAIAPLATKAELHQEIQAAIAPLATKAELQAAIAPLATKAELELWGGALVARIQQGEQRIGNVERGQQQLMEQFQEFDQRFTASLQLTEQRLMQELARHTSAVLESMQTQIKASFEPLADLPGRVSRLEAAVFDPTPRSKRTRRRTH